MKCADVLGNLNDDGDLGAVRRHLESCAECARRFARDLEIEKALRNLKNDVQPVNVTTEVRNSLGSLRRRRSRHNLVRRWVWVTTSVATVILLMITMPVLAGWLGRMARLADGLAVGSFEAIGSPAISSTVSAVPFVHLCGLMIAGLACLGVYLWREARRAVE
jgi:anti-sigma factor RsiW